MYLTNTFSGLKGLFKCFRTKKNNDPNTDKLNAQQEQLLQHNLEILTETESTCQTQPLGADDCTTSVKDMSPGEKGNDTSEKHAYPSANGHETSEKETYPSENGHETSVKDAYPCENGHNARVKDWNFSENTEEKHVHQEIFYTRNSDCTGKKQILKNGDQETTILKPFARGKYLKSENN